MIRTRWLDLEPREQDSFRAAIAFLGPRLGDAKTIDWALTKATSSKVLRVAITHLLDTPVGRSLDEPWLSAWRIIEEYWTDLSTGEMDGTGEYDIRARLSVGERSGSLVRDLVGLVVPTLEVESHSALARSYSSKKGRPKTAADLFSMRISSGKAIDQSVLKLNEETDAAFIYSLCVELEAAVSKGLELGKRLGWDGGHEMWRLGQLHRVYHVPTNDRRENKNEPDEFHVGIAPSVKLLYAVTERLIDIDQSAGTAFVQRWERSRSPIFLRLWAALARKPEVASDEEVARFLLGLGDEIFWLAHYYPEVAELRARRFKDLSAIDQAQVTVRIKKMPSRKIWSYLPREISAKREQILAAVQELTRIKAAGGVLGGRDEEWLQDKELDVSLPEEGERVDEGFPESPEADWVQPNPDARFDSLVGDVRLDALAEALSSPRSSWSVDPAQGAADWLQKPQSLARVLKDLESTKIARRGASQVWERVGWMHTPQNIGEANPEQEAKRVLLLLSDLPDESIALAIEGISHWLSSWQVQVASSTLGRSVWARVWPFAVTATNTRSPGSDQLDINTVVKSTTDQVPMDLDTLNTPAGKLVGVFMAGCPNLKKARRVFGKGRPLRIMRDLIMTSDGRAHLIALHRMIEELPYFLNADKRWALKVLIPPLLAQTPESKVLWRALARRIQFKDVVKEVGEAMLLRSTDLSFSREIRQMLATNLVVECLTALLEDRSELVPVSSVQQMLRSVEDEVRANVATVLPRFVQNVSSVEKSQYSASDVFRKSAAPFLKRIWPQESSLATPGVSKALAVLPAAAKEAFADAVHSIERFLVPFDAWSMIDYGLYGDFEDKPKIEMVNDSSKAKALLLLLDRTIGTGERAIVPHELAAALSHIRSSSPELGESSAFRRLAVVARR